jgi:imidazoleglycerol-phosphate dehydratase/histidinol-phosphatase
MEQDQTTNSNRENVAAGKRILFIDRDGVILQEPPTDFQIDSIEKTSFVPGAISALSRIAAELDYYKVMVTNQDGLGTNSYPENTFHPYHDLMLRILQGEGFVFDEMVIDKTFAADNKDTRKPGTGLLKHLIDTAGFDLANSYVIGDRWSDIQLAKNLGCKAIYFRSTLHELTQEKNLHCAVRSHLKPVNGRKYTRFSNSVCVRWCMKGTQTKQRSGSN